MTTLEAALCRATNRIQILEGNIESLQLSHKESLRGLHQEIKRLENHSSELELKLCGMIPMQGTIKRVCKSCTVYAVNKKVLPVPVVEDIEATWMKELKIENNKNKNLILALESKIEKLYQIMVSRPIPFESTASQQEHKNRLGKMDSNIDFLERDSRRNIRPLSSLKPLPRPNSAYTPSHVDIGSKSILPNIRPSTGHTMISDSLREMRKKVIVERDALKSQASHQLPIILPPLTVENSTKFTSVMTIIKE